MDDRFLKVLERLGLYWKPDRIPFDIVQAVAKWKHGVKRYNLAKNHQQQVDALKWLHKVVADLPTYNGPAIRHRTEKDDGIPPHIKKYVQNKVIVRMPKRPKKH